MGLNIQGIATNIKINKFSEITDKLGFITPKIIDESTFEESLSNSIGDNEFFFTSASNGTIITVGDNIPLWEIYEKDNRTLWKISPKHLSKKGKVIKFMIGETSGSFAFQYCCNGQLLRSYSEHEEEVLLNYGKPLELEFKGLHIFDVINKLILEIAGDNIDTLDLNTKSIIYKFLGLKAVSVNTKKTLTSTNTNKNKWWKFW